MRTQLKFLFLICLFNTTAFAFDHSIKFIQIAASTKEERTQIVNLGVSLEAFRSDSVWGFATDAAIKRLQEHGIIILGEFDPELSRGGHTVALDFPPGDARYHNYQQIKDALIQLQSKNSDISHLYSLGKTIEGRDIWALQINTSPAALKKGVSNKPGALFMGAHHAREHLSVEIPLMLAQYLLTHRTESRISKLLESRDIWIIPMVNPDGAEYDISTGEYKWWRKNRRNNGDGTFGVDLNRNYSYEWGTGGSDRETSSDIYMGTAPFSEPETQAIRDFVESHLNANVLLTFHTFSELILYPWGHTYDPIGKSEDQKLKKDQQVFEMMAKTMAKWNHYKPEQSSQLYIASGDTTDWAYGAFGTPSEKKIFAFTFELSPSDIWNGGFYPGAGIIDKVFADNLKPCLYMIDVADNPYKVLRKNHTGWLKNYIEPRIDENLMWEMHPLEFTYPKQ